MQVITYSAMGVAASPPAFVKTMPSAMSFGSTRSAPAWVSCTQRKLGARSSQAGDLGDAAAPEAEEHLGPGQRLGELRHGRVGLQLAGVGSLALKQAARLLPEDSHLQGRVHGSDLVRQLRFQAKGNDDFCHLPRDKRSIRKSGRPARSICFCVRAISYSMR